jgi:hypothetical protein
MLLPEIWMTLPLEAKNWLLHELKRQQQDDDKLKIQTAKIPPSLQENLTLTQALIQTCPMNTQKEEVIHDQIANTYGFKT